MNDEQAWVLAALGWFLAANFFVGFVAMSILCKRVINRYGKCNDEWFALASELCEELKRRETEETTVLQTERKDMGNRKQDIEEQARKDRNEKRLIAGEIIRDLYYARDANQLRLLQMQCDRSLSKAGDGEAAQDLRRLGDHDDHAGRSAKVHCRSEIRCRRGWLEQEQPQLVVAAKVGN